MKQKQVARMGGHARAASLSPERRREIALAASVEAARKRHGQVTTGQLTAAYVARLKSEDAELGRFVELAIKAPPRYADSLAQVLADDERELALQALEEVSQHLEAQRA